MSEILGRAKLFLTQGQEHIYKTAVRGTAHSQKLPGESVVSDEAALLLAQGVLGMQEIQANLQNPPAQKMSTGNLGVETHLQDETWLTSEAYHNQVGSILREMADAGATAEEVAGFLGQQNTFGANEYQQKLLDTGVRWQTAQAARIYYQMVSHCMLDGVAVPHKSFGYPVGPSSYLESFDFDTLNTHSPKDHHGKKLAVRLRQVGAESLITLDRLKELTKKKLRGVTITGDLSFQDLSYLILDGPVICPAYGFMMQTENLRISFGRLHDCMFACANLSSSTIESSILEVYMPAALMPDVHLYGIDIRRSNLNASDMRGIKASRSGFTDTSMRNADLRGAYISDATFHKLDLRGACLEGATLERVQCLDVILPDGKVTDDIKQLQKFTELNN